MEPVLPVLPVLPVSPVGPVLPVLPVGPVTATGANVVVTCPIVESLKYNVNVFVNGDANAWPHISINNLSVDNNVVCGIHYDSQHKNSVYSSGFKFDCPKSEEESKKTVSIPFNPKLTMEEMNKILKLIKKYKWWKR